MKCPKCGSEMEDMECDGDLEPLFYLFCPDCGHESKVGGEEHE